MVKRIPFNILMSWDQVQASRDCRPVSCSIVQSVRLQWLQKQQGWMREDSHSVTIFLGRVRIKMPNEKEAGYGSIQWNIQPPFQMMLLKLQPGTGRLRLGSWQQQALGLCAGEFCFHANPFYITRYETSASFSFSNLIPDFRRLSLPEFTLPFPRNLPYTAN